MPHHHLPTEWESPVSTRIKISTARLDPLLLHTSYKLEQRGWTMANDDDDDEDDDDDDDEATGLHWHLWDATSYP